MRQRAAGDWVYALDPAAMPALGPVAQRADRRRVHASWDEENSPWPSSVTAPCVPCCSRAAPSTEVAAASGVSRQRLAVAELRRPGLSDLLAVGATTCRRGCSAWSLPHTTASPPTPQRPLPRCAWPPRRPASRRVSCAQRSNGTSCGSEVPSPPDPTVTGSPDVRAQWATDRSGALHAAAREPGPSVIRIRRARKGDTIDRALSPTVESVGNSFLADGH